MAIERAEIVLLAISMDIPADEKNFLSLLNLGGHPYLPIKANQPASGSSSGSVVFFEADVDDLKGLCCMNRKNIRFQA